MNPFQIVIDTNVMVAGLRSKRGASYKLLAMLKDERWQINVSSTLIFEYEEVLKRERASLGLTPTDIDELLDGICAIANKRSIFYLWRPTARDPKDDFLVDLAVESQSDFIITFNKKDLREAEKFGIILLSPKEFLQKAGEIK